MPDILPKSSCFLCLLLSALFLHACTSPSGLIPHKPLISPARKGFQLQSVHAHEPPAPQLESLGQTPANPDYELSFQTTSTAGAARIPLEGSFQVKIQAGTSYALLDADATDADHQIILQVPAQTFDLYLQPAQAALPPLCQSGNGSSASLPDQMDQRVLDKINSLIAQNKAQCTVLPPQNQRQNANCNSTASGIQCSGSVNKTLSAAACPEMAIYAGAMNLNHDLSASTLFVATSNNLTLNQSAKGVLTTRGNLNTSLNNNSHLAGVMVGGSSNNLNMTGNSRIQGLYTLANGSSLSANFNNGAIFEGALCATGNVNANRNGTSQTHYHPEILTSWLTEVPNLPNLLCPTRSNFYTQTTPLNCSLPTPASLQLTDSLYGLSQSLTADGNWYRAAGRPTTVPADWQSPTAESYILQFENHGTIAFNTRWFYSSVQAQVPASVRVIPAVDCVKPHPQGGSTAYLSYTNLMTGSVSLTGLHNQLIPGSAQANLPVSFEAGQSPVYPNSPVSVNFTGNSLTWNLGARSVSIQADDPELQCPETVQSPELLIQDVVLSSNGLSILGQDAPERIEPDYAGQEIALTLSGVFKDSAQQPLSLNDFLFTLAPPLVQQTFVGTEPSARVLLDDSILLETTAVSATEIQAVLRTEKLPDLYLKGLHKLSVEQGDWYTDALIQVGEPAPPAGSLMPSIESVVVMRDAQNNPLHIRLTGQNFMVYPKFSYATIDGEFGFGYQTEVLVDGSAETVVHVPHPETFDQQSEHVVIMATPFGVCFKEFE